MYTNILKRILIFVITFGFIILFAYLLDIGIMGTVIGLIGFSIFVAVYTLWLQRDTYNFVTELGANYILALEKKNKKRGKKKK